MQHGSKHTYLPKLPVNDGTRIPVMYRYVDKEKETLEEQARIFNDTEKDLVKRARKYHIDVKGKRKREIVRALLEYVENRSSGRPVENVDSSGSSSTVDNHSSSSTGTSPHTFDSSCDPVDRADPSNPGPSSSPSDITDPSNPLDHATSSSSAGPSHTGLSHSSPFDRNLYNIIKVTPDGDCAFAAFIKSVTSNKIDIGASVAATKVWEDVISGRRDQAKRLRAALSNIVTNKSGFEDLHTELGLNGSLDISDRDSLKSMTMRLAIGLVHKGNVDGYAEAYELSQKSNLLF